MKQLILTFAFLVSFASFGQTPYVPFVKPNLINWEFDLHLNKGDTLFVLNNNSNAGGYSYTLIFRTQLATPTGVTDWSFNYLIAPYDMDVHLRPNPQMEYVLDNLYGSWLKAN